MPPQVRAIVRDAVRHSAGMFIAEPFQRMFARLLFLLPAGPLAYMLASFFARRFRWQKALFSTIIPVVPLRLMWDSFVL